MASSPSASPGPPPRGPNPAFRQLRGGLSPGEFAAAVRRSAREIGEHVACDARYVGRVESGEIRCPNYAYERVFLHMFPGHTLRDMGFAPRDSVRGRAPRARTVDGTVRERVPEPAAEPGSRCGTDSYDAAAHHGLHDNFDPDSHTDEESDVLRRAFMAGGPAALASASLGYLPTQERVPEAAEKPGAAGTRGTARAGAAEADGLERAVRHIRLLDDRHGADTLYRQAGQTLCVAHELLDAGAHRQSVSDRLHAGAGELAISVGWLAHDSGRLDEARSHYAEALATARIAADSRLEAHAFCNTAFLARDADRPREAVRAAQAGQQVAKSLGSARLLSLLALREAGGWAGLAQRSASEAALARARTLFARGASDADPAWMSFFGEAELEGLQSQCWAALGAWEAAVEHARRAVHLQEPHFVRNRALFTAELAGDLAARGEPVGAVEAAEDALALLGPVRSGRIRAMLTTTARRLETYRGEAAVANFLARPTPRS